TSAEDIALTDDDGTDIRAGALTAAGAGAGGKVYTLAVSGITKNGSVSVKVAKAGYAFSPDTQSAQVHPAPDAITFINLTADGLKSTTAALTLIFDRPVPGGLTAANITLTDTGYTGIRAGALTDEGGGAYRLAVSGIRRSGDVTVQVHKAGYAFTPDTRTAQARAPIVKAAFTSLWQNDYRGGRTYDMTLIFDKAIPGLSAANIAFTDTGGTGIQKGALEDKGGGAYLLKVSGIWRSGSVTVKAASAGYAFSPDTQSAQVLAPQIWFESFTADGSAEKGTLALTLTFSRAVSGLTADDITLSDPDGTGIQKAGALTRAGTSGTVYTLAVSGITKNSSVSAKVAERAGNTFADSPAAQVYKPTEIAFASLAADGGDGVVTAGLTLQFGKAVPGLSIDDITLTDTDNTGIRKGALTDKGGGAYALAVSGVTKGGAVTVKAAKAGYAFSPPSRTTAVRYGEPVTAEFLSLTEDGYAAGRTTALTLIFDRVIGGLTAGDITLTDTGGTGIRKGALTDKGGGAYALTVSGVTKNGSITARVSKAGYTFARDTLPARVYWGIEFLSLAAEEGTAETTALALLFDRPVPGLTAGDITLADTGGTGIRLRASGFTHLGGIYAPGAYRLEVSGITKSGSVTAKAAKAGYAFSPDTQSAQVYAKPVPAAFVSLAQIDEGSAGTKALALTFDQVIPGLSADDITLTDTGNTGIRFRAGGIVTQPGGRYPPETYFLAVTGVTKDGTVTVKVRKTEWAFAPDTQSTQVLWTKPEIEFRSLSAEQGTAETTALTLKFDRPVPGGLTAADIALTDNGYTGIQKGALTDKGGGEYRLAVSNVTKDGTATVKVSKEGYAFIPRSLTADVYANESATATAFRSLTATPEGERTTALTLTFDKPVEGLSAGNITLEDPDGTGIQKGALTYSGGEYRLAVSGITKSGTVTVWVWKSGYAFTPSSLTAQVSPTTAVAFRSLTADGGGTATTSALTLRFDKAVAGLSAGDIALEDTGGTGIRKGALKDNGGGAYTLAVSGITKSGAATVKVSKAGYVFTPTSLTAQVWLAIPVAFQSLTAEVPTAEATTALYLRFDKVVSGLSADNIALTDTGNTGIQKGALTDNGGGAYTLSVSGIAKSGAVTATAAKEGYAFTPPSLTVRVYRVESVQLQFLTANGRGSETTTALTLKFDKPVEGLSADDITLEDTGGTGIQKGALTDLGGNTYRLAVNVPAANGTVTLTAAKMGYTFDFTLAPSVWVWSPPVSFSLGANGSSLEPTTALTLTFDRNASDLLDQDKVSVWLVDIDGTDIQRGALTYTGGGTYRLAVSGIHKDGDARVELSAYTGARYVFSPSSSTTRVYRGPMPKPAAFTVTADGGGAISTSKLTLTFNWNAAALPADDITLEDTGNTGIRKGALTLVSSSVENGGEAVYTLAVSGVSKNGTVTVKVKPQTDGYYSYEPDPQTVQVYGLPSLTAKFLSLTADGSPTTSRLYLSFDRDIPYLSADDITLGGDASAGAQITAFVRTAPGAYSLAVSGIARNGTLTVKAEREGYVFTPDTREVQVYGPQAFLSLTADGVDGRTSEYGNTGRRTTALTLELDRIVPGLSADDITLDDPEGTGIQKGALTHSGGGVYTLKVDGITKLGEVTAEVAPAGQAFTPRSREVEVYPPAFRSLAANGGYGTATTGLIVELDQSVPGLSLADITLEDLDGTGIYKVYLFSPEYEPNNYSLGVDGVTKDGAVRVTVAPEGIVFTPSSRTAQVHGPH
ncbi:hypothetical protein, partial [Treponema endosymbiont of Eucomonympha sp.]|uniref:hypothetical protein n=1 Tax=Treponema endosymbiont of Eucomonympha sp. TaxID=1580831 RepID=UPI000B1B97E0